MHDHRSLGKFVRATVGKVLPRVMVKSLGAKRRAFLTTSAVALVLLFVGMSFSSCITPPEPRSGEVIDPQELFVLSHLRSGNEYTAAGRYDLAEREYRLVLNVQPRLVPAQSALAFVLVALGRYAEAIELLRDVLQVEPKNVIARDNLARSYYHLVEYEAAEREFERLRDAYLERISQKPTPDATAQLALTYRNLAILSHSQGILDEAQCQSAMAVATQPTAEQYGQHIRLLLSLDQVQAALQTLAAVVPINPLPSFLADYAMALYVSGDKLRAEQAALRVLASPQADSAERRMVRLLRVFLAEGQKNVVELQRVLADLEEDRAALCEPKFLERQTYWPTKFIEESEQFLMSFCIGGSSYESGESLPRA